MEPSVQENQSLKFTWKALFLINLILGLIFWIGNSTDLKSKNLSTDIVFTWLVGVFGLISWLLITISSLANIWKRLFSYFVALSIIGSTPYLFLFVLITRNSYTFDSSVSVDKIVAPDQLKTIEVHYTPDFFNIYCGHKYQVSLHYDNFPFLRRDIIDLQDVPNDPDPLCIYKNGIKNKIDTEIAWIDNTHIIVPFGYQNKQIIDIGLMKYNLLSTHMKFLVGYFGVLMILHGIQRLREKQNADT